MIYFIGDFNRIEEYSPFIQPKSIDEAINEISSHKVICEDTETSGLDPRNDRLRLVQLGTPEHQYVFSVDDIDISKLAGILSSKKILKIVANVYFERSFFHSSGIVLNNTFDVLIAAKVLRQGRSDRMVVSGGKSVYIYSLAGIYKEYLDIDLSKEEQTSFLKEKESYSVGQIMYAAKDVEMFDIYEEMKRRLIKYKMYFEDTDLSKTVKELLDEGKFSVTALEQKVALYFTDMVYSGIRLDPEGLIEMYNKNVLRRRGVERDLNKYIIGKYPEYTGYYVEPLQNDTFTQYSLFGEPVTNREKKAKVHRINWGSHVQVKKILKLELEHIPTDKHGKETADIKVLGKPKYKDNSFIKSYIEYSKLSKLISSYGEKYLSNIHSKTGRIHAGVNQILNTGRVALYKPNLAQIPGDKEWRELFSAEAGNKIVGADYSGQESRVMADKARDTMFIDFYENGGGDGHSMVASRVYSKKEGREVIVKKWLLAVEHKGDLTDAFKERWRSEYPGATKETMDEKYFILEDDNPDELKRHACPLRSKGKVLNFFISFGGSAYTLSESQDLPLEEAKGLIKGFWDGFKDLHEYFENEKKFALNHGYIVTNEVTKRRRWLPLWKEYRSFEKQKDKRKRELIKQFGNRVGIDTYFNEIRDRSSSLSILNRHAYRLKGDIEREAMNTGIQGTAADMTKTAEVLLMERLEADGHNLISLIRPVNHVHDEIMLEAREDYADYAARQVKNAMEDASKMYMKVLTIPAKPYISSHWQH